MNCYYFIRDVRSHFISLLFIRKRDKLLRRSKYSFKERLVNRRYIIYIYILLRDREGRRRGGSCVVSMSRVHGATSGGLPN